MAVGNGEPGVEVSMAIPTTSALASTQSTDISNAVTTGALSTQWGKLGDFLSPSLSVPIMRTCPQAFMHLCMHIPNAYVC